MRDDPDDPDDPDENGLERLRSFNRTVTAADRGARRGVPGARPPTRGVARAVGDRRRRQRRAHAARPARARFGLPEPAAAQPRTDGLIDGRRAARRRTRPRARRTAAGQAGGRRARPSQRRPRAGRCSSHSTSRAARSCSTAAADGRAAAHGGHGRDRGRASGERRRTVLHRRRTTPSSTSASTPASTRR